jgi:pimeloyl-ACP methyl ester carboxylesterase
MSASPRSGAGTPMTPTRRSAHWENSSPRLMGSPDLRTTSCRQEQSQGRIPLVARLGLPTFDVAAADVSRHQLNVAGEVPDGRLTIFEDSGHSPHVTEAEEFNRQLLDFVASHGC